MEGSITIQSFTGGLSNDKNAWPAWSFYDCGSVDIRKNMSFVKLWRAISESAVNTSTNKINAITLDSYTWWTVDSEVLAFCDAGYMYSWNTWEFARLHDKATWSLRSENILNVVNAQWYNWIISTAYIYRYLNSVSDPGILPTNTFASGWTWTNWSFSLWALHTTGSTVALTQSSPITAVVGEVYHIICDINNWGAFAWTCTVSIWWATSANFIAWRNDVYLRATTTAGISFTPSSTFDGTITYVRVERVSDLASSNWLGIKQMYQRTITNSLYAPAIVWNNGDVIYWSWNSLSRINNNGTHIEYSTTLDQSVIWWLLWTVRAITQVWSNVYVWCNDGGSTNLYIWDGITSRPSEKITIGDRPVINCALLNNEHYWWAQKWIKSQKYAFQWSWYQNNPIIKSDIPQDPTAISSFATGNIQTYEQDRLAFYWENTNAIETFGDIVYLPGYWKLLWFWNQYPWNPTALDKSITFNGTECTAMLTTSKPTQWQDYTFYMFIGYKRGANYYIWKIDMRDWNGSYSSQWFIDTIEYMASSTDVENNWKKYTARFNLPHSSTSIKIYRNINRWWFALHKTIDTNSYGTWFNVVEVPDTWKWDTIQYRFELLSSNSLYSPEFYIGFKSKFMITEKR